MSELPSPPPDPDGPHGIAPWRDRGSLLDERRRVLDELTRRSVGPFRLLGLVLVVLAFELGWGLVGVGLMSLDDTLDGFNLVFAGFVGLVGVVILVPALAVAVSEAREARAVRALLRAWTALDRDPRGDARYGRGWLNAGWLMVSFGFVVAGLAVCAGLPDSLEDGGGRTPHSTLVYVMGAGIAPVVAGLAGLVNAVAHLHWLAGLLNPVPAARRPGGAHR
ncbi:hypothetical protein [Streptomyces tsukubensis]|uniref:Uncharacterized protein n=1 Tax=Streptomyces tsukubensis (strain DSM 42081 / NBRC 108919 / NRRL 18488 / 9993) TaxID=1114943 RepID=A0A7G3UEI2_STRT9|nr:hypothetical protein [Streptomyces tsukubensis]AZK96008.1 hypothetical protein B7R87_20665 [Streptomyces tsukubensis]QKM67971.1 hypothetical protein STSU_013110 [Streptomyces tsukubensis NRRL18488]TAI44369.1 hypothetical protein EWI31_12910 [Streptomyces tsukubensis]